MPRNDGKGPGGAGTGTRKGGRSGGRCQGGRGQGIGKGRCQNRPADPDSGGAAGRGGAKRRSGPGTPAS